ncbi:hypothetical protein [Streptomyces noursei]|uniref:hypothetical protein n=1 Tax=Streptomyces noursei TaxID=1971 RepID=UPI001676BA34|nr:hypothetical protein [Streptomyces noursei]MCZ1019846.1 hypothetical protein [Streptomyces noursei]GGX36275.1 hypothetical protein GCM10010341_67140 [Streptomyces noursei]
MYLITRDPEHGLVVAPRSRVDIDTTTETALRRRGFCWNATMEAYTHPTDSDDDTKAQVAVLLVSLGHTIRVL